MQSNGKIALIPTYEPSESLVALAKRIGAEGFQVLIVDDGSGGKYESVFKSASAFSTVIAHDSNKGKGRALKTGLSYIHENFPGDAVIVTLDADGQHRFEDVLEVSKKALSTERGLVLGSRSFSGRIPARSRFGNAMTRFVYRASTGIRVRDTQTGLRAFGSGLIPFMLGIGGEGFEYEMNVLLECAREKVPIEEVSIETVYIGNNTTSHFKAIRDSVRVYGKIVKFAASSFTGFLVDFAVYGLMVLFTQGLGSASSVFLSNVTARAISSVVNFEINKRFVFKTKEKVFSTAIKYFALAAFVLVGNTLLLSFLVGSLRIDKFIAKITTELVFFAVSWLVQKLVIFKKSDKKIFWGP